MALEKLEQMRILVVDDEPSFQMTIREILESEGYVVQGAENGESALRVLESNQAPSLIILDLMMPTMNGFEFVEAKLRNPKLSDIPVIVVTAGRASVEDLRKDAIQGFLKKPFHLEVLLDLVRKVIANSGRVSVFNAAKSSSF